MREATELRHFLSQGITRRDLLRRGGILVGAGVAAPWLAACTSDSTSDEEEPNENRPNELNMGLSNAFVSYNPALSPQLASLTVIRHVFEPLVRYNPVSQALEPWMIQEFPTKTATDTFEATLLPGLTFHDGSPVTAGDVVFTIEYMQDPDNGAFLGPFLNPVESVSTQGDTLIFKLVQEYAAFPSTLSIPYIIPEAIFTAQGNEAFQTAPVGSGPYVFGETTPGLSVTLEKYEGYEGRAEASLDTILLEYIVEGSTREVELIAGELDIIDQVPYRDLETLGTQEGIETGSTLGQRHMVLETNHVSGPFADPRVRQAFLYGIDRQAIIDTVFQGQYGAICDSILPTTDAFFVEPSTTYRPDPDRARSLLAEAGHPDGLDFELLLSTIPWITEAGTLMKDQLAQVGMNAEIRLTETEAGYGIVATTEYDTYVAYGVESALGADPDVIYRVFNYGSSREGFYGSNTPEEQEYDSFVDEGLLAATDEDRRAAYAQAQEIMSSTVMNNFPLIFAANLGAWANYVQGYTPPISDVPDFSVVSVT